MCIFVISSSEIVRVFPAASVLRHSALLGIKKESGPILGSREMPFSLREQREKIVCSSREFVSHTTSQDLSKAFTLPSCLPVYIHFSLYLLPCLPAYLTCLSVCLPFYLFPYFPTCLLVCHLLAFLPSSLHTCLSILPVILSTCPSASSRIYQPTCLPATCLPATCLPARTHLASALLSLLVSVLLYYSLALVAVSL